MQIIMAVLLLALALLTLTLHKAYRYVPLKELSRQAAGGNRLAKGLHRAAAYGLSLQVLLVCVAAVAGAGGLLLLSRAVSWPLALPVAVLFAIVGLVWLPKSRLSSLGGQLARLCAPSLAWTLSYLDRPLRQLAAPAGRRLGAARAQLHQTEDLLDLLDLQALQPDSRITPEEINLIKAVLQFSDRPVREVMRSRKTIKTVAETEAIGPILLDELHASGQDSFPVKKTARGSEIAGRLQLANLNIHSTGTVADYMKSDLEYITDDITLAEALHRFYVHPTGFLIVGDKFGDYLGIVSLRDILADLTLPPKPAPDKFDGHAADAGGSESDLSVVE